MAIGIVPKVLVIDGFLRSSFLNALLDHASACEPDYRPARVTGKKENPLFRLALKCRQGLGELRQDFEQAIHARLDEMRAGVGIPPFPVADTELELVAHGDGAFFKQHIDTYTRENRKELTSDRILSCVYYFYREPRSFTGGELAIYTIGGDELARSIDPVCNRLVVFPSFVMHEVMPVSCPSGSFADSRFAINCWINRARGG